MAPNPWVYGQHTLNLVDYFKEKELKVQRKVKADLGKVRSKRYMKEKENEYD